MNAECISELCIINFANSASQESHGRFEIGEKPETGTVSV